MHYNNDYLGFDVLDGVNCAQKTRDLNNLRGEKSTSQNAYSVLRYPKFLCNIHFERYAICLYNFPLTDFVNPNVYAIWEVMHYESDAKREV